jgi:hypothetical protein
MIMEKKVKIKCTVAYGNKNIKDLYTQYIKSKLKEENK